MSAEPHTHPWGKPTLHRGVQMRSRLEAAWAAWLDQHRIRWEYEPERFELGAGLFSVPDFRLSDVRAWLECKGQMRGEDAAKLQAFRPRAAQAGSVVLLGQYPAGTALQLLTPGPGMFSDDLAMLLCDGCRRWYFAPREGRACPACGAWERDLSHVAAVHPHDGRRSLAGDVCNDCNAVHDLGPILGVRDWTRW